MTRSVAAFAGIDWGTTRLRAWLLDAEGEPVAERRSDEGLLSVDRERFAEVLEGHLAAMGADPALPVLICGMAGSRQGWVEAPYVATPAEFPAIFAGAMAVPCGKRDIRILPGVAQNQAAAPDVMRGEETQLAGVAKRYDGGSIVCMPGTHSKWAELKDGRIERFSTWMTGELFSVLAGHSILRHAVGAEPARVAADDATFGAWLADGLANPEAAMSRLFRIRASTLLLGMRPEQAAAALSGLLIGSEVGAATREFGATGANVLLVVSGPLGDLYAHALKVAGCTFTIVDAEAAVRRGLAEAARVIFREREGQ